MVNTILTGQTTFKRNGFTVIFALKITRNYNQCLALIDAQTQNKQIS